jgi:small subunit ribosomal protein S2
MAENQVKDKELIDKLFSVGAHYGYTRTRRHPSMTPFIFGSKNRVEVFDLEKVKDLLLAAKSYVYELGQDKKTILIVGGKHEVREVVRHAAQSIDMPFVAGRWIGGTLTNFSEIKKRIQRLEELQDKRAKGELEKYTKREQLDFDREIADLEAHFGGLVSLRELPKALFVIDTKHENIAVREAREVKIPVVGFMNADGNVPEVAYPLIGNDSALSSVTFFVNEIVSAYREGYNNPRQISETKEKKGE